jgi:hypothetical protein
MNDERTISVEPAYCQTMRKTPTLKVPMTNRAWVNYVVAGTGSTRFQAPAVRTSRSSRFQIV